MMVPPLRITFIDNDQNETDDWVNGHPCINVGVFYTPIPEVGIRYTMTAAWALIDSGADHVYVHQEYLDRHSAPKGKQVHTNNEADASHIHQACISIVETAEIFTFKTVIGRDLKKTGMPYHVVLGRAFLSSFRLDLDIRTKRALLHR